MKGPGSQAGVDRVLLSAAVLGAFDPDQLLDGLKGLEFDAAVDALGAQCDEAVGSDGIRWTLKAAPRRDLLATLTDPAEAKAAIAAAPDAKGDPFAETLRAALLKEKLPAPPLPKAASTAALAAAQVADGARHAALQFAAMAPYLADSHSKEAIDAVRVRMADRDREESLALILPDKLIGRADELGKLWAHASGDTADGRPMLVTGLAGVGKSALVAALVRRQIDAGRLALQVDFDRPDLQSAEPLAIFRSILRQLEIGLLHGKTDDERAAVALVREMRNKIRNSETARQGLREEVDQQLGWVRAHGYGGLGEMPESVRTRPMLLVYDSFEAISHLGAVAARRVLAHAHDLVEQSGLAALRTVVAGRDVPLPESGNPWEEGAELLFGPPDRRIHVEGLTPDDGAEFLKLRDRENRFPDRALRRTASQALDGHPLALIVLEQYVRSDPSVDVAALVANLKDDARFSGALAHAFLYTRILDRISDEELRRLASPGLALRTVTPDLIRLILAEPCKLGEVDTTRAHDLFDRLCQQYWLVEIVGTGHVRHHPEMRRVMLPLMLADAAPEAIGLLANRHPDQLAATRAVCRGAAAYWRQGPPAGDPSHDDWARHAPVRREAEALHYEALAGAEPPPTLDATVAATMRDHLGGDFETLPRIWQTRVLASAGDFKGFTDSDREQLSEELRTLSETAEIEINLKQGRAEEALQRAEQEAARIGEKAAGPHPVDAPPSSMPRDLRIAEQQVRSAVLIGQPAFAAEPARFVLDCWHDGRANEETLREIESGRLWATGLWEAALIAATGGERTAPDPRAWHENLHTATADLLLRRLTADAMPTEMKVQSILFSTDGLLRSVDGSRFAVLLATRSFAPRTVTIEVGSLSLAEANLALALRTAVGDETALDLPGPALAHALDVLARFHAALFSSVGATLLQFEEVFTSGLKIPLALAVPAQHRIARQILRPLAPELHAPASRLLAALPPENAAQFANELAEATVHWPSDFWFEAYGAPPRTPRRRRWDPDLCRIVVQTADRCGVLGELLSRLKTHDPAADWLHLAHQRLTNSFSFQDQTSTGRYSQEMPASTT